jgi:oxygen-independent coproporphyrinogen-3 oxidase
MPLSLYIHIPFCQTLCTYCAFNTYAGLNALIAPYLDALRCEMRAVSSGLSKAHSHSLFLGGGTPSLLDPEQVASIVHTAREHYGLSPTAEITLEANPGATDEARLTAYRAAGVNRLSLGIQSAHAGELRLFGRRHTPEQSAETFAMARRAGFDNISLDLIYGAPHQTLDGWDTTLHTVLAWQPDHLSLYALTLEPGTSLHIRVKRGTLPPPDPDLAADMYDHARLLIAQAGLAHYEISNWACPGFESLHNRQYWLNRPYLGFGAGAHGSAGGVRYWNVDPVREYIDRIDQGPPRGYPLSAAAAGCEEIARELEMSETLILGLRLVREGVGKAAFAARFGCEPGEVFGPALNELTEMGLISVDAEAIRLTERAYLVSNQVFVRLLPD